MSDTSTGAAGGVGNDLSEGGLACAGRPPEEDGGEELVGFNGTTQELPFAHNMLLADEFFEGARAHARGERRLLLHTLLHGMVKKIVRHAMIISE